MTKIGKAMHNVTEGVMKAGGIVTKNTGEALGELGKSMGVSKEKCNKIEQGADNLGKDMYYAGRTAGSKVEQVTNDMVDGTKKAYKSISNKFKS